MRNRREEPFVFPRSYRDIYIPSSKWEHLNFKNLLPREGGKSYSRRIRNFRWGLGKKTSALISFFLVFLGGGFYFFHGSHQPYASPKTSSTNTSIASIESPNGNRSPLRSFANSYNAASSSVKLSDLIRSTLTDSKGGALISNQESDAPLSIDEIGDMGEGRKKFTPLSSIDPKIHAFSYSTYTVKKGDTLWELAYKLPISLDALLSLNQLNPMKALFVGQKIKIPPFDGLYIKVKKHDTVENLARKYGLSVADILKYNNLGDSEHLHVGITLFLPDVHYTTMERAMLFQNFFKKPLLGIISSPYGFREHPIKHVLMFHTGIDIAGNMGRSVHSSRVGRVTFAGKAGSYGNLVIVKHSGGYSTYYGHLSKIFVHPGSEVTQNTTLGLVGSTGISTGPHLHFEIRQNNKILNPLTFVKY